MRKIISLITLILLVSACNSQRKKTLIGDTEYQQKLNESYKDGSKSPLKKNDLKNFKGLEFYPVDTAFIVTATLTKTKHAATFEMATTTDRKPLYKEYGILTFTLKGIDCSLTFTKVKMISGMKNTKTCSFYHLQIIHLETVLMREGATWT